MTSAEAVLVSLQSHAEVLKELDSAPGIRLSRNATGEVEIEGGEGDGTGVGRIYVASVSPQTRASIAAAFGVSEKEAGYMIEQLLCGPRGIKMRAVYRNAFQWVVDTNVARDACLVLGAQEVMESLQDGEKGKADGEEMEGIQKQAKKPILTSSCPGWVCYAEKTHPHVLPHLSRLKSPQALMGTLLKTTLSRKLGISPDRIWHVAIMPCFDKKLEASREELTDAVWEGTGTRGIRDVDSVITSKELLMLADSRRIDFSSLPRTPQSSSTRIPFPDTRLDSFIFPPSRRRKNDPAAGSSGGNLYYILQYFASQHVGSTIQTTRGRNADVVEYSVNSATGESLFKAARYYGFRNIQNLVRKLKPPKASRMPGARPVGSARRAGGKPSGPDHVYIEVMACPGGCTNGGGQIKADDPVISGPAPSEVKAGPAEQKAWLAQVDEAYFSGEDVVEEAAPSDDHNDLVEGISPSYINDTLAHWASMTGIDIGRLVYTSYREVVSDVGKKAGEMDRVIEIAGKIGGGW